MFSSVSYETEPYGTHCTDWSTVKEKDNVCKLCQYGSLFLGPSGMTHSSFSVCWSRVGLIQWSFLLLLLLLLLLTLFLQALIDFLKLFLCFPRGKSEPESVWDATKKRVEVRQSSSVWGDLWVWSVEILVFPSATGFMLTSFSFCLSWFEVYSIIKKHFWNDR